MGISEHVESAKVEGCVKHSNAHMSEGIRLLISPTVTAEYENRLALPQV